MLKRQKSRFSLRPLERWRTGLWGFLGKWSGCELVWLSVWALFLGCAVKMTRRWHTSSTYVLNMSFFSLSKATYYQTLLHYQSCLPLENSVTLITMWPSMEVFLNTLNWISKNCILLMHTENMRQWYYHHQVDVSVTDKPNACCNCNWTQASFSLPLCLSPTHSFSQSSWNQWKDSCS